MSLIFRKRSADSASDDFFSESDDDWFESDLSDGNETVSEECQNFTMPTLTPEQMANLLPLMQKYKKDGFSSEVGRLSNWQLHRYCVNHQIEAIFSVNLINQKFYPEPYCSLVDTAPTVCYEESLLELWARDGDLDRSVMVILVLTIVTMICNHKGYGIQNLKFIWQ